MREFSFLGFTITRNKAEGEKISFAPPATGDSVTIENDYNFTRSVVGVETLFKDENDLIEKYRELALYSEVDSAIQDIVSEAITEDFEGNIINLDLSKVDPELLPENLHKDIYKSFEKIKSVMNVRENCAEYFRKWYIEGRLYFHAVIDSNNIKNGVIEYRNIDPLNLKPVTEIRKEKHPLTGVELYRGKREYWVYSEDGGSSSEGLQITSDSIVSATSGIIDSSNNITLSYLHKSMRPANQLRMIEDANIIYFLSRSPERRLFEVETNNLGKTSVDSYMHKIMNAHRNKISYDSETGAEKESRRFLSILEDYWIPVRDGKGVKVTTLQGGSQLTQQLESINYFRQKLYKSLNIPISRIDSGNKSNVGRATEITRDEIKFAKFIATLRNKFSKIFKTALRLECILSGILKLEDWEKIEEFIIIDFAKDNHFFELKDLEILSAKLDVLDKARDYEGKFFSRQDLAEKILGQTEEEYDEIQEKIKLEKEKNPVKDDESESSNSSGLGGGFGGNFSGGFGDEGDEFGDGVDDTETEFDLGNNELENNNQINNIDNTDTLRFEPEEPDDDR